MSESTPNPVQAAVEERQRALDFKLANAIADLTGQIGRCETRNLMQLSLHTPERIKAFGAIMDLFRNHYKELTRVYQNQTRKITWVMNDRDPSKIEVFTSVGGFYFAAPGHEVYDASQQRQYRW